MQWSHMNRRRRGTGETASCGRRPERLRPSGWSRRRIVTALISGFMAKESVVSSLTVLFGSMEALQGTLTVPGAVSLLVFCLLYTPCVAAIASVKRELGGKWAAAMAAGQCVLAWIVAFIVYQAALFL